MRLKFVGMRITCASFFKLGRTVVTSNTAAVSEATRYAPFYSFGKSNFPVEKKGGDPETQKEQEKRKLPPSPVDS